MNSTAFLGVADLCLLEYETPPHLLEPSTKEITANGSKSDGSRLTDCTATFISWQRQLIAKGCPIDCVLGSDVVNVSRVFCCQPAIDTAPGNIPQWTSQLADSFDTLGVPEGVGLMFLGGLLLRVSSKHTQTQESNFLTYPVADSTDGRELYELAAIYASNSDSGVLSARSLD